MSCVEKKERQQATIWLSRSVAAALLFTDAPKHLVHKVERLVRFVRSKGVGVFFVTQSPTDVPAAVLEQLGTRILHAMRARTAESLKKIKAAADTIRPRKGFKTREELPVLKIGEALISVTGEDNVPSEVEKVKVIMPAGQIGPIPDEERKVVLESTPLRKKYHHGSTSTPPTAHSTGACWWRGASTRVRKARQSSPCRTST
ncbi:MAG: DUF853 family protein [Mesorhizobium sp.]|nr:MAG: DUF853 family protein [Mesorhizobium sp.]